MHTCCVLTICDLAMIWTFNMLITLIDLPTIKQTICLLIICLDCTYYYHSVYSYMCCNWTPYASIVCSNLFLFHLDIVWPHHIFRLCLLRDSYSHNTEANRSKPITDQVFQKLQEAIAEGEWAISPELLNRKEITDCRWPKYLKSHISFLKLYPWICFLTTFVP